MNGAATMATIVSTTSAVIAVPKIADALRSSSRSYASTNSGTSVAVRIPPRMSSKTMLGVLFATL